MSLTQGPFSFSFLMSTWLLKRPALDKWKRELFSKGHKITADNTETGMISRLLMSNLRGQRSFDNEHSSKIIKKNISDV